MADARVTQASFTAGELSPELYSRRDLAKYQVGVRLLENFYVLPYGGVQNRPGLRFVGEVKDSTDTVRLQRFEAAADQSYLMEMGPLYFRYYYQGGIVLNGMSPAETVTPYDTADLPRVYTAQSNDVMTITARGIKIRELANTAPGVWTLSIVDFSPSVDPPTGVSVDTHFGLTSDEDIGVDKRPHPEDYAVSAVSEDGEESVLSNTVTSDDNVLGFQKNYNDIDWDNDPDIDSFNVYKKQNGVFGYIGFTTQSTFRDDGIAPDLTRGPVTGRDPFNASQRYPAICSFCQQRRVFANSNAKPQSIFMTVSANFSSMQVSTPARDDDAVEFALAANKKQDIFHMLSVDTGLVVFTRSGEWVVTGREGDVITPSSIFPKPQSSYGAHRYIQPLIAGEQILFVPGSAKLVYEIEYSIQVDKYKAANLALLANHLFKDRTIVSWDFAERPNGIVWCVMSDGAILSLTYLKEHDVWGWARHATNGRALDVCVVPENGVDVPYFLIERRNSDGVKKFIEYLPSRDFDEVEDGFFLDSGLSYANTTAATVSAAGVVTAASFDAGDEIMLKGVTFSDLDSVETYDFSGKYIVTNGASPYIVTTLDGDAVSFADAVASGDIQTAGLVYKSTQIVTGLDHLVGRTVTALADGNVIDGLIVDEDGGVDLGALYYRVHVGLPYVSSFESLDIVNPQQDATGATRGTPQMFVALDTSRGFAIGETLDTVEEMDTRIDEAWGQPGAPYSGSLDVTPLGGWTDSTRVAVKQTYPLPLTILGITTEITYGG